MSSLRGRTRDSSWQWFLIGFVLASGCASVVCLGTYAAGLLHLPGQDAAVPTTIPITAPPPVTVVTAVTAVTQVVVNSSAATVTPNSLSPLTNPTQPGDVATTAATVAVPPANATAAPTSPVQPTVGSAVLAGTPIGSPEQFTTPTDLIPITGGAFIMGTDQNEVVAALKIYYSCQTDADRTKCQDLLTAASDSMPSFKVVLNSFQIEKYEVTNKQYVAFLNSLGPKSDLTGCDGNVCALIKSKTNVTSYIGFDGTKYDVSTLIYANRPVTDVTWYGANSYCKALGRRLPSEAEWEYAARGPKNNIYPWGNDWNPAQTRANTAKNNPTPVGGSGPNPVNGDLQDVTTSGVYDMAGNVAEWVNDWYAQDYYKSFNGNAANPQGPDQGDKNTKVYRGGDFGNVPFYARAVQRRDSDPLSALANLGFRCATSNLSSGSAPSTNSGSAATATPAAIAPK